jgi:integrase
VRRAKGEGSIFKRKDGRWQARYQAGGKRTYIYGKTRQEVVKKLTEALSEVNKGLIYDDKGITVERHIKNWLTTSKNSVRIRTWERYEQICRRHIFPEVGHLKLKNLTPVVVQDLYQKKLKVLSPRTVVYVHVTLHRALSQALRWNLVPRNVTDLVDPPRIIKEEVKPLAEEEVNSLFETVRDNPLEALYVLAVTAGLRKGELLGLKWSDINFVTRTLQIKRRLSLTKDGPIFVPPKTVKGKRSIGLSQIAVGALRRHKLLQDEQKKSWSKDYGLVFPNNVGVALTRFRGPIRV